MMAPDKKNEKDKNRKENSCTIQLRGSKKDFNFQLHHRLSKFEVLEL